MKDTGLFLVLGVTHRKSTIKMASICAFSDGALALAGNRIFGRKNVADTHIIERID